MKDFLKQVAAVIVGFICISFFMTIMTFIMLLSLATIGSGTPNIKKGSVLHIQLKGGISERAEENPFNELIGENLEVQGLDHILNAIKKAKTNDNISGIYLEGGLVGADFAMLEEIRQALVDFKESNKFILAYGDQYTQGSYYVASAADTVLLNPSGMLEWHGIASRPIFFKEVLEKIGVKMQVFRVGTFKSAVEPFTNTEMSEPNRAQVQSYINDIWQGICQEVAASRKMSTDSLQAYANRYSMLAAADDYIKMGLVDQLTYQDEVREKLRDLTGEESISLVSPQEFILSQPTENLQAPIAVYYAFGDIVDEASTGFGASEEIVGKKVVEDLDEIAHNEDIKAVVLRINSGGGSAYASEQMWRAIQLLKTKKPVVVSMGGLAASGGYYMACGADHIIAEPTTLTGSIGIFGMVPDVSGLLTEKLGVHFDVVKTNESSDFGAMGRSFNAAESAAMQAYVERGYDLFLRRVAEGRNMDVVSVDSIAQGRVWTGRQALELKLVDQLGNLEDAIAAAARLAQLEGTPNVAAYPNLPNWLDQLGNTITGNDYMENKMRAVLGVYYQPLHFAATLQGKDCLQARIPYDPNMN